ncbi:MAG: rhodanese-like domain-containing protein [Akkermansiaceae bacterium]
MLPDTTESEEITPQQLAQLLEESAEIFLVDCREKDEWDFNRIERAKHWPLSKFPELGSALLASTDRPMVIYCHHGVRSLHLTRWLRHQGRQEVYSVRGGIDLWSREIDPSVPLY